MASILDEIRSEVESELSAKPEEPKSVLEEVKKEVSTELASGEPKPDFFQTSQQYLEEKPKAKISGGDVFLNAISHKRQDELDEEDRNLFNSLSDEEQYKVAQARKDIPLDESQARKIFEVEKSKMPSVPTSWEDWYNLGGEAFDVAKKVGLGAGELVRDVVKATDMQVSDEDFYKNLKNAKGSFYSFMAPAFELPESVLWATEKAKAGGFSWADALGEKTGLITPEDRFERWKARRLIDQAHAEYFREHPNIYGRLMDSPLTKEALASIAKWEMESPKDLADRTGMTIEQAKAQQDAMVRQGIDELTSKMEEELPEEKAGPRIAGEFLLPGEVGMGTMGAVSIGMKMTPQIARGLKYIGKSADEINEINKAAQILQKQKFDKMLEARKARAESIAGRAGRVEEVVQKFKPIAEKTAGVLGKVAAPVAGGVAGYSVSEERPLTGLLTGALGGAAAGAVLKGTKLGLELPTLVKEVAEARKVAPLGKTFETLGRSAEGSALKAKLLSHGGKTIDNILSNSAEYAKAGIHGTTLALATGALESASPEEMEQILSNGLAISLGGRALQHIKGKFMGVDPVIAQRERLADDSRIRRRYQEADPDTQANLNQIASYDNAILFGQKKVADAEIELTNAIRAKNPEAIKNAESVVKKTKRELDIIKRANVQTRNEFGREFLKTYANLQDITNGVLKTGQNNVGFNILSTDQIFQKLRNDPANRNVPDGDLMQMAGQAGFYSSPAQEGVVFDRKKPSIVLNSDSIRARISIFGETPTQALEHEANHFINLIPEYQDALADVRSMLFQNEIRDAAGNVKATIPGVFSKAKLVELFNDGYLRHLDPQGKEAFAKLNKLWDESRGALDENKVSEYMKSEIMADLLGEVTSRHLGKDLNSGTLAMFDRARIKARKNILDRAINRFYGFGGRGDIVTAANTMAQFPPEAMSAARDAMRQIVALNGEISPPVPDPQMPKISRAQMLKNSALIERFGKDSPLFKTEFKVKVFDKDGNQIGESMPVSTPNPREATFQNTDGGFKKLSGYGEIPAEAQGLQVPEGGTLVVSRDLVMQPDGITPVMYKPDEAKELDASRKKLIIDALDTDDYGTPNRFEPVSEGSETYRGTFTPLQIQAIKDLPESLIPKTLKQNMLMANDAIARGDGTRFIVDYAAVMNDKGKYQAFSPKIYDLVPIGMHLSKKGNFLITTISIGRIFNKMRLWNERMPGRLRFWDNNLERTFDDFVKYLNNWQQGKPGETGLDINPQIALQKKNIFNDLLNLKDEATRYTNPDRTVITYKKGDPRGKDPNITITSIRVDHIAEMLENPNATKLPVSYGFAKQNFMPERMEGEIAEPIKKTATQPERFPTPERGFYSGLQQTIDQKVQGKFASPDQLKAIISNPQNVKSEELKWSGVLGEIDRLAKENQGKIPKDKVMEYLRNEGDVKFEEVTLDADQLPDIDTIRYNVENNEDGYELVQKEDTIAIAKNSQLITDFHTDDSSFWANVEEDLKGKTGETRYSKYQLPGGENYREVVLSMPENNKVIARGIDKNAVYAKANASGLEFQVSSPSFDGLQKEYIAIAVNNIKPFTSTHFPDIPNYIAHMRLNERTDAEGNDGLFIEELQSDRHQQGREKGYKEDIPKPDTSKWRASKDGIEPTQIDRWRVYSPDNPMGALFTANSAEEAISRAAGYYGLEGIPDAPFRKDWGVQLFKRALRDAVESGKSWIGWTTGDTQAERYDLSKQIGKVVWNEDTKMLTAYDPSQKRTVIQESNVTSDKLADYVGKEVAQKLVEQSPDDDMDREISGLDLKIGGEGMKGFYDQILPKEIGKYVAKMGGKVEKSEIERSKLRIEKDGNSFVVVGEDNSVLGSYDSQNKAQKRIEDLGGFKPATAIWRVNITPEMAGKVKGGQLQFMPERMEREVPVRKDWDEMLNQASKMSYDEFLSLAKKGKIIQATGEPNPFKAGTGKSALSYGAGAGYSLKDIVHFYSQVIGPTEEAYKRFIDHAEYEKRAMREPERPVEQERIVAATYTDPRTGEVREGVNHKAANPNAPDEQTDRESRYYGFRTDAGRVVDREEAYRIAEASGQLKEAISDEDKFNAERGVLHSNMVEMEPTIGEKTEISPKIGEQISVQDAIQLVAGKTEKPGGVDPAIWFNENDSLELRNVPLSEITPNQEGEKYDGTVNLERAKKYSKIPSDKMPPIILVEKKRNDDGLLNVLDGGHRVSAARMRGDDSILAIVRKKPTISEKPKSSEIIGADMIKPTDIETSAKPASDAVIKPDKNDKPVEGDLPKQTPLAKGENFEVSKSGDVFVDDITKPIQFTKDIGLQFMPARPEVNLEDFIDKPIIALTADRMGIGRAYVGPKGSEQEVSQESQGGPGFSFLYTDEKSNPVWGFTRKEDADRFVGRITSLAKKEKSDSILVAPTLLSPENHLHNPTGQLGYAEAIDAAIKAKFLDRKLADSHIEQIMQRVAAGKALPKADKDKFSAIKSLSQFTNAVKAKEINFRQAALVREKAAGKTLPISVDDMTRMGILPSEVAKNLAHKGFYDLPTFSVVSLFEVPANQKPEKGEYHYSYPWIVRGKAIGFLKNIYNLDKLTSAENVRSKKTGELTAQPVMVVMPQLDPKKIEEASKVLKNLSKPQ